MEGQLAGVAAEVQGARRASVAFAARGADPREGMDPEVLAKAKRRQFSAEHKRRILREADAARDAGEIGAQLRREGLYSSLLSTWRGQRERGELAWLAPRRRGRKQKAVNPLTKRVAELERDKRRLKLKLKQAELLLEIQKKLRSCSKSRRRAARTTTGATDASGAGALGDQRHAPRVPGAGRGAGNAVPVSSAVALPRERVAIPAAPAAARAALRGATRGAC